jgi:hypothetical protein
VTFFCINISRRVVVGKFTAYFVKSKTQPVCQVGDKLDHLKWKRMSVKHGSLANMVGSEIGGGSEFGDAGGGKKGACSVM